MHLAFTGTKEGWTINQAAMTKGVFKDLIDLGYDVMHNGDCKGSDYRAALMWKTSFYGKKLILHPPTNPKHRAFIDFANIVLPEGDYIVRDHQMVDMSSVLVGTPARPEYLRSGTWATIRYARKIGIPRIIIYPDGSVVREEPTGLNQFTE